MADTNDYYDYQADQQRIVAAQLAARQEAARFQALTPRQRRDENVTKLKALQPVAQTSPRVRYTPDVGEYSGGDENLYNQQNEYDQYDLATSVRVPYLGPTVSVNPYTGQYFRHGIPIGTDVSKVGQAGTLPGTQNIINDHLAHDPMSFQEDYERLGRFPTPDERQGRFVINDQPTDEELYLQNKAASGNASSPELARLSRLRADRFEFKANELQRGASKYLPPAIMALSSIPFGAVGGWLGPALGAGWGAMSAGTLTKWDDPAAVAAGAAGGFAGAYGGGAAAKYLGAGPVVTGAASGFGGGIGGSTARGAVHGEFDPGQILTSGATGAVTGGAGAATGVPGQLYAPLVNFGTNALTGDDERRHRRNPFA